MTDQTRHRCRHIFVDGRRCGSASLRNEHFCYYHHTTRRPATNPHARKARRSTLNFPNPEDRAAIQLSIGLVLERLASNDIDPRRAGLLLYGLQIASSNLPPHQKLPAHAQSLPEQPLEEVIADSQYGLLAPPAEALKTRQQMWDDIQRERKLLSEQETQLRQREEELRKEQTRLLQERIRNERLQQKEIPAPTTPPSPSYEVPTNSLVLQNLKAHAVTTDAGAPFMRSMSGFGSRNARTEYLATDNQQRATATKRTAMLPHPIEALPHESRPYRPWLGGHFDR